MATKESLAAGITAVGDAIRVAKTKKAGKDAIMSKVAELKSLKAKYAEVAGEPWPQQSGENKGGKKLADQNKAPTQSKEGKTGKQSSEKRAADSTAKYSSSPSPKSSSNIARMGSAEVSQFLSGLTLERYAGAFAKKEVDGACLIAASDADLASYGMSFGPHRKKLLTILRSEGVFSSHALSAGDIIGRGIAIVRSVGASFDTMPNQGQHSLLLWEGMSGRDSCVRPPTVGPRSRWRTPMHSRRDGSRPSMTCARKRPQREASNRPWRKFLQHQWASLNRSTTCNAYARFGSILR